MVAMKRKVYLWTEISKRIAGIRVKEVDMCRRIGEIGESDKRGRTATISRSLPASSFSNPHATPRTTASLLATRHTPSAAWLGRGRGPKTHNSTSNMYSSYILLQAKN